MAPREHTPAPWTVDWLGCVRDARNEPIETASPNGSPEGWANACLIAAAPDLYAALCAARDTLFELPSDKEDGDKELLALIDAALRKADGDAL